MSTKICLACRSKIDLLATRCPHCRSKQPKLRLKGGFTPGKALLLGLGIFAVATCARNIPPEDPTSNRKAEVAAEVGDTVSIRSPATTIMCSNFKDQIAVFTMGTMAFYDTMRLSHDSAWDAVRAEYAAREQAMRTAYSCRWAPDSYAGEHVRYTLVEKNISVANDEVYYRVQVQGKTSEWWVAEKIGRSSPFENVKSPQPKTMVAEQKP